MKIHIDREKIRVGSIENQLCEIADFHRICGISVNNQAKINCSSQYSTTFNVDSKHDL